VLGILAFDAPAPHGLAVLSAIAASGLLIVLGIVGLANASSTRHFYGGDAAGEATSADSYATEPLRADHGGVERRPCN
jgi:hypothetical protein